MMPCTVARPSPARSARLLVVKNGTDKTASYPWSFSTPWTTTAHRTQRPAAPGCGRAACSSAHPGRAAMDRACGERDDQGQQVVEGSGDAAGHAADRLHPLRLAKALLALAQPGLDHPAVGHVARVDHEDELGRARGIHHRLA